MTDEPIEIRQCEYFEPDDNGDRQCPNMGRVLRLKTDLGQVLRTSRCREHSDWEETK